MGSINQRGFPTQCTHCGYKWLTNSERSVTSCPRCGWRVRLKPSRQGQEGPVANIQSQRNAPPRYF